MDKWSRRKFLEGGVAGAITVSGARAATFLSPQKARTQSQNVTKRALEMRHRDLLRVSMDEIIPGRDGMPTVSEVGGVDYLDHLSTQDEHVAKELRESLVALEDVSSNRFKASFLSLSHEQRMDSLIEFEQRDPKSFRSLQNYVYEAYYIQPRVRQLIGYEFNPTNGRGTHIPDFDEAVLAEVRKKPKYYREV